jgi:hypothetical protein
MDTKSQGCSTPAKAGHHFYLEAHKRIEPLGTSLGDFEGVQHHVSSPLNVPTIDSPVTEASHAEATSVYRCDRRGTESSKPRSRPTNASDERPTDAVLRLSQHKAARLLSMRLTDADVSVCHANAPASITPLHSLVCHLGLGDIRYTVTYVTCVVHVCRVFLNINLFHDFATSSNLRCKGN